MIDDNNMIYWKNFIILLNQNISKYGIGLILVTGNFGSFVNCWIFSQPNLRKNPCVMYFLASSASQFLTFNFALLTRMLHYGYNMLALTNLLWYCKIRFYFFYIFIAAPRYHIVMASIDRYFASCHDIYWRRWSSAKIAKRFIIFSFIFWCLIYSQVLVFYDILNDDCSYQAGSYGIFFTIYLSIESGLLPPLIMLIFGILTIRNIQLSKRTVQPQPLSGTVGPAHIIRISQKDVQLSKMLLNQIILWIVLNIPNPCYLLYLSITLNNQKSAFRMTLDTFIKNMSYLLIYLEFGLTFFTYTLSSPLFRRELKKLIRNKIMNRFILNTPQRHRHANHAE